MNTTENKTKTKPLTILGKKTSYLRIKLTANHNAGEGTYSPVNYGIDLHDRINHRGLLAPFHINNSRPLKNVDNSHNARKDRYEVSCLERCIRPYNYPESLWMEYLRDAESEEHTAKCEAKNAWMYEY